MNPAEVAERYILERDLCHMYGATILSRAERLPCFDYAPLNRLLADLRDAGRSPWTVKGWRGDLLTLWRFAADIGEAEWPNPRRIRCPRIPAPDVSCFTAGEAAKLVRAAEKLTGHVRDGPLRRHYWPAIICVAWDTGLRRGDLWRVKASQIRDGVLYHTSAKTGQRTFHRLYPSTLERVALLDRSNGSLLFEWPHTRRTFVDHFAAIRDAAGVAAGTFKWLRRSSGSYVEAQQPGSGWKHLGHTGPATFARHYDARAVSQSGVRPPELI